MDNFDNVLAKHDFLLKLNNLNLIEDGSIQCNFDSLEHQSIFGFDFVGDRVSNIHSVKNVTAITFNQDKFIIMKSIINHRESIRVPLDISNYLDVPLMFNPINGYEYTLVNEEDSKIMEIKSQLTKAKNYKYTTLPVSFIDYMLQLTTPEVQVIINTYQQYFNIIKEPNMLITMLYRSMGLSEYGFQSFEELQEHNLNRLLICLPDNHKADYEEFNTQNSPITKFQLKELAIRIRERTVLFGEINNRNAENCNHYIMEDGIHLIYDVKDSQVISLENIYKPIETLRSNIENNKRQEKIKNNNKIKSQEKFVTYFIAYVKEQLNFDNMHSVDINVLIDNYKDYLAIKGMIDISDVTKDTNIDDNIKHLHTNKKQLNQMISSIITDMEAEELLELDRLQSKYPDNGKK